MNRINHPGWLGKKLLYFYRVIHMEPTTTGASSSSKQAVVVVQSHHRSTLTGIEESNTFRLRTDSTKAHNRAADGTAVKHIRGNPIFLFQNIRLPTYGMVDPR